MNDWIAAGIAAGAGLLLGGILARFARSLLDREGRPDVVRAASKPLASVIFSVALVIGQVTALGFVNEEARDQIPQDLVDYVPSLLSAAIVLIGASILAQLVQTALEPATARLSGPAARNIPHVARTVIMGFAAILAAAQLGVDTTIINIAVAALLFSIGLGAALMVGLGSRDVSGEVAAGRAVRRLLQPGDHITVGEVSGQVVEIQSVAVEVAAGEESILVPHSQVLGQHVTVRRRPPDDPEAA